MTWGCCYKHQVLLWWGEGGNLTLVVCACGSNITTKNVHMLLQLCSAGTIYQYCTNYIVNLPTLYPYWYVLII